MAISANELRALGAEKLGYIATHDLEGKFTYFVGDFNHKGDQSVWSHKNLEILPQEYRQRLKVYNEMEDPSKAYAFPVKWTRSLSESHGKEFINGYLRIQGENGGETTLIQISIWKVEGINSTEEMDKYLSKVDLADLPKEVLIKYKLRPSDEEIAKFVKSLKPIDIDF